MSSRSPNETPELEALFQCARQIETSLHRERTQSARLQAELEAQAARHAREIEQAKHYAQQLLARDHEMRKHLGAAQSKLQAFAAHANRLQEANARLSNEVKDHARKTQLEVTAARTSFEHMKERAREHEDTIARLRPELERARQELERVQSDLLEREHRYQASVLSFQGRDHGHQAAVQAFRDQIKHLQDELNRYKSRWLDTERMRQEADKQREEAEAVARRQSPSIERLQELEEANLSLTERLAIEKRQRMQADSGSRAADHEREHLQSALRATEERLAYTEAQLAKASSEAALLRAARRAGTDSFDRERERPVRAVAGAGNSHHLRPVDLEMLEKFALPGYPIQD